MKERRDRLAETNGNLLDALKAAYQVLSGHHDALGHDSETDPTTKRCVGCDALEQARNAIEAAS
jgi:hypothetical protein